MVSFRVMSSLLFLFLIPSLAVTANGISFDSIYQLGDSLSDTGNLMIESNTSYCSFPPYGMTSFPNKPSGRCSDGFLMIDFFAKAFNLPLVEPYLKKGANFSHGVNFAVAGATALDGSLYHGASTNSSLNVQLGWFRDHLKSVCPSSTADCKKALKNTLFLVGEVGGNDYNYALLTGQRIENVTRLVPAVVQTIADAVNEVIEHGAVQVVVPGNFPIGCMAAYLTAFRSNDSTLYDKLGCLKPLNEFAELHNNQLKEAIKGLQKLHPGVAIHYGDYYNGLRYVLRNAASLGFEMVDVLKPCCGDVIHFCGGRGVGVCSEPKKKISWDGVHLTQEAYRDLAHWLLSDIFPQSSATPAPAPAPLATPAPAPSATPAPAPAPSTHSSADSVSMSTVLFRAIALASLALFTTGSY